MYDNITPEQWIYGLWAGLIAFSVAAYFFWRYTHPRDVPDAMSSEESAPVRAVVPDVVHVPVRDTGTAPEQPPTAEVVRADTDALNTGTSYQAPRISRSMSDRDIIIMLAVQRSNGKHRFSANQIAQIVGGARAEVLALIKEARGEHRPEFKALSPEQQAVRDQLGLSVKS